MKIRLISRRNHHLTKASTLLIMVALITTMVGCAQPPQYNLTISATEGGEVTTPSQMTSSYEGGAEVPLVALPHTGYRFVDWTGDVSTIDDVNAASTTVTMNGNYSITANFIAQYGLTIDSTDGGEVTTPGEGTFTHDAGTAITVVAEAEEGYQFVGWTGDVDSITDVRSASTTITMNGDCTVSADFGIGIYDWYDLDTLRDDLDGSYVLMNNLDSTTSGYTELASQTANGGQGWEPIGSLIVDPFYFGIIDPVPFTGIFCGQGYEIRDMISARPNEDGVGLFGLVGERGVVQNLGVMNAEVAGCGHTGGLAGSSSGTISNSYSSASITGEGYVGGLVGGNAGTLSDCHSTGSVTGEGAVGGLTGGNWGAISNSYSADTVSSVRTAGGLVGWQHHGSIRDSYFRGTVTGQIVGGLVAENNDSSVTNSYYSYDEVLINGRNIITIGALWDEDFERWLANDRFLDVNEGLAQEDGCHLINNVDDFKSLLAFCQDHSLKFRLNNDLDLATEANFYIPYLAGEFDGSDHKIRNLTFDFGFVSQIGLFGYVVSGARVSQVAVENVNMSGHDSVGALVGRNEGTVSDCYSTGRVAGEDRVGGLVGKNDNGTVSNSYYNYDEVLINGRNMVSTGALAGEDFEQWLDNDKLLSITDRLSQEDGYYLIDNVSDFKSLLAFAPDDSLKFRLTSDLDLAAAPNFYIPYLAGEFDGSNHRIRNLTFSSGWAANVGLFGYLASGGKISGVGVENVNVTGCRYVGALIGQNAGTVSHSYSTGSMTGEVSVGGLVGENQGSVTDSYSTGSVSGGVGVGGVVGDNQGTVTGSYSAGGVSGGGGIGGVAGSNGGSVANAYFTGDVAGEWGVGGVVGTNGGTVDRSYSIGRVTGMSDEYSVGGLVGQNWEGTVSNSFWDTETSDQSTSDGGIGKTTAQMKTITTFSSAGWNMIGVANPSTRNPAYIWNIVDGQTYPFLSWQP